MVEIKTVLINNRNIRVMFLISESLHQKAQAQTVGTATDLVL
jgi:hypothetical protein